jgi:hypothetical protein
VVPAELPGSLATPSDPFVVPDVELVALDVELSPPPSLVAVTPPEMTLSAPETGAVASPPPVRPETTVVPPASVETAEVTVPLGSSPPATAALPDAPRSASTVKERIRSAANRNPVFAYPGFEE